MQSKNLDIISWQTIEVDEIFDRIKSGSKGLSQADAQERFNKFGPNRLKPSKKRSQWILYLSQFHNTLIYVLLISTLLMIIIRHWVDAGVILGVVILNSLIGFIQEAKADKALDSIRNLLSLQANVYRDNKRIVVNSEQLVFGDVVFIQSGDKVPADLRLIKTKNLRIDEASLTGESISVEKSNITVEGIKPIGDRTCMAFSGTIVTYGQGTGLVVATGEQTEIGKISSLIAETPTVTTPLLQKISEFGRFLTIAIVGLALGMFLFGIFIRDYKIIDMFLAAVGLAVAAIPEGLPAIVSITLAIGVQCMAKKNAIIRRLPSVETLGSVTVICSDKTGTLTHNEMTVKTVITASDIFDISGSGYDLKGEFLVRERSFSCYLIEDKGVACNEFPNLVELARSGLLCNEATLYEQDKKWSMQGDPTEGSLLVLGVKAGLSLSVERLERQRLDIIPFESEHRFMATLNKNLQDSNAIYIKGAPEVILETCDYQMQLEDNVPLNKEYWQEKMQYIASLGQRPLAIAKKNVKLDHTKLKIEDVKEGMIMLGIVGITDPPRGAAISAVRQCKEAGIKVKMITGDHVMTAKAIGAQMGIGDGTLSVSGQELDKMSDEQLREIVKNVDVFARVSPEHKLRLVKALQANGEIVAMTGDGVNDAPALKRADIGIAMGIKGTEAAKDVAEMVLADDNFASIAHAVEEGRTVYANISKGIMFILPTSIGEAGIIIAAVLLGTMLPITPVQILWVNMITAVTLGLSLSFEPSEKSIMKQAPRNPNESILTGFLIWRILFVGLILVVGTFGLFVWQRFNGASIEIARTVAVNTMVMFEVFFLFSTRYMRDSVLNLEGLFGNGYLLASVGLVIVFQIFFTYLPFMQNLFGTVGISMKAWIGILLITPLVLFLVEIEKYILSLKADNK